MCIYTMYVTVNVTRRITNSKAKNTKSRFGVDMHLIVEVTLGQTLGVDYVNGTMNIQYICV